MQDGRNAGLILVGICSGSVGTHGEIKVRSFTDNPRRFMSGNVVIIGANEYRIERARTQRRQPVVKLVGVDTPDQAQKLNNQDICIKEESVATLPEDQYYHFQLLGMEVVTISGDRLGTLTEILMTGSNDVYVIKGDIEILIPAISGVIVRVDVSLAEMTVDLPEGL